MPTKKATAKKQENVETNNVSDIKSEVSNEENTTNSSEIIEVEWDNVRPIFEFRQKIEEMENYFANMCLQFEKSKANMISQITYGQNDLYMMAEQLQKSKNIDATLSYELKLPTESGQKGFFVRKDD